MTKKDVQEENEIKLYTLLVDELFKHHTNIWQIPTALITVNFLVLNIFQLQWYPLTALLVFNAGMIFVFCQLVNSQKQIINTIKLAEDALDPSFRAFLPKVKSSNIPSTLIFVFVLIFLELFLACYIVSLCCAKHLC
jgi:hypothetical protein